MTVAMGVTMVVGMAMVVVMNVGSTPVGILVTAMGRILAVTLAVLWEEVPLDWPTEEAGDAIGRMFAVGGASSLEVRCMKQREREFIHINRLVFLKED